MTFAAQSCQVKIKMKALASFNKIPGFPKLAGYKFMNMNRTNVIVNEKQMLDLNSFSMVGSILVNFVGHFHSTRLDVIVHLH